MIADLDGEDLSGRNRLQLAPKMISPLLDLRKCAHYLPVDVNDGRAIVIPCPYSFPCLENWIFQSRPHLPIFPSAAKFWARF
jgi:hypothetical protein